MEQKIKEIITKADDLSKKIRLLQNEKTLPVIELDIILLDIRTLYEEIRTLQSTAHSEITASPAPAREVPVQDPPVKTPPVQAPSVEVPPVEAPNVETPPVQAPPVEVPPVEVPNVETPPAEIPDAKGPAADSPQKTTEPTILADRYKGEQRYINESLSGNPEKTDLGSKIQSKPIQNIGSALGINDRFLLIKDLFNGDKDSFQNTISVLNEASNFNEAFNYITSSFDWNMEEPSVQLLLDLVRRKFIVNQDE